MAIVDRELLERLARLSRIEIVEGEKKLLDDIQSIVAYFDKIRAVKADARGSTSCIAMKNVVREDVYDENRRLPYEGIQGTFPDKENGYLRVPKVL